MKRNRKSEANRRWRAANARLVKAQKLRQRYGISIEEFEALVLVQGNRCAICQSPPKRVLYVDHDHDTGTVRGLLCMKCNLALHVVDCCPEWPENARKYLGITEC